MLQQAPCGENLTRHCSFTWSQTCLQRPSSQGSLYFIDHSPEALCKSGPHSQSTLQHPCSVEPRNPCSGYLQFNCKAVRCWPSSDVPQSGGSPVPPGHGPEFELLTKVAVLWQDQFFTAVNHCSNAFSHSLPSLLRSLQMLTAPSPHPPPSSSSRQARRVACGQGGMTQVFQIHYMESNLTSAPASKFGLVLGFESCVIGFDGA